MSDLSNKPTLRGDRVILRPFEPGDGEIMLKILTDPELQKLTGSCTSDEKATQTLSDEETLRFRHWYETRNEPTDRVDLAIVDRATGQLVGEVVFNDWNENARCVNFRILIGPIGRNRGLGQEAIRLFVRHGFETLNLNRIQLEVFDFNPRALAVYRKTGFVLEGTSREAFYFNGRPVDVHQMAILRREYRPEPECESKE